MHKKSHINTRYADACFAPNITYHKVQVVIEKVQAESSTVQ